MLAGRAGKPIGHEDWLYEQVQPRQPPGATLQDKTTPRISMNSLFSSSTIGSVHGLCDEVDDNMLQDLQLAAQLGKTLLERNKELENMVKLHHTTVEEQAQEIEYMKKQSAALREVNDSRMKIYEQLEVSIQDLERANHRLALENKNDKKVIKGQTLTIENLEARVEELQRKFDELNEQHEGLLRQQTVIQSANTAQVQTGTTKGSVTASGNTTQNVAPCVPISFQETNTESGCNNSFQQPPTLPSSYDTEMTDLMRQLQEARSQRAREQKKVTELGQQLANLLQENNALEEQLNVLRSKAQDVKNLQDEISTLEEVRRGQLCARCLRGMDTTHNELSVMLDQEEYDDISLVESIITDTQRDADSLLQETNKTGAEDAEGNPYRVLVEKYQALIEVQKHSVPRWKNTRNNTCLSLQEELKMSGEFNSLPNPTTEPENQQNSTKSNTNNSRSKVEICSKKPFSATPTDFSEAETSSSGFSDETSNKATQTEGTTGSLLCSIADGEDCKFSIYDDNNPFESRFRKTPEYRQLFSEIFSLLKKAAEASDEGVKLPLLDNTSTNTTQIQSPIIIQEDIPSEATDDNQSVISSVISSVVSEPPYRIQSPTTIINAGKRDSRHGVVSNGKILSQQNGSGLDYLSVHVTKKGSAKKTSHRKLVHNDKSTAPDVIPTTNPRFVPTRSHHTGKRKFRPFPTTDENGTIYTGYVYPSRRKETPNYGRRPSAQGHTNHTQHDTSFECREYKPSTASVDVQWLKRLEMSYAEVLRLPNKSKPNNHVRSSNSHDETQYAHAIHK